MNLPKPTAAIAPTMHGGLADPSSAAVVFTPPPMLNLTAADLVRSALPPSEWPKISPPLKSPQDTAILDATNNNISELQKFANELKMEKLARKRLAYKNRAAASAIGNAAKNLQLPPPHLVVKTSKLNVNAPVFVPKTTMAGVRAGRKSTTTTVVAAQVTRQQSLGGITINEYRATLPVVQRKEEFFNARDIAFPPDLEDREINLGFKPENERQVEFFNVKNSSLEVQATFSAAESQSASSTSNCPSFDDAIEAPSEIQPPKIALVQNWNLSYDPSKGPASSSIQNVENCNAIEQEFPDDDENERTFTVASTNCLRIYDKEQMYDVYRSLQELGKVPRPTCLSREFDNEVGIFQPWKWIEREWQNDEFCAKQNFPPLIHKDQKENGRISQNGLRRALVNDQVNRLIKKGMTNFVSRQLVNAMTDQLKMNQ